MLKIGSRILIAILLCWATVAQAQDYRVDAGETLQITSAHRCAGTPLHTGPMTNYVIQSDCRAPDMLVGAMASIVFGGLGLDAVAWGKVIADFNVEPGNSPGTELDAWVSAELEWDGSLQGANIYSGGASVEIEMILRVYDGTADDSGVVTGRETVLSKEQIDFGLKDVVDIGYYRERGTKEVGFPATIVRGRKHSIELLLTCTAHSGGLAMAVISNYFNDYNLFDDLDNIPEPPLIQIPRGFTKLKKLSISVKQDPQELLERLALVDERLEQVESIRVQEHLISCNRIVDLMLPETAGGRLEEVFARVEGCIAGATAAGMDTKSANWWYSRAESYFERDDYYRAYENLCRAYKYLGYQPRRIYR